MRSTNLLTYLLLEVIPDAESGYGLQTWAPDLCQIRLGRGLSDCFCCFTSTLMYCCGHLRAIMKGRRLHVTADASSWDACRSVFISGGR